MPSPQLAIFAASPIDAGMYDSFIALRLARYAGTCAGKCLAPTSRDGFAAVFAVVEPLAGRQPQACAADRVTYGIINLILHRTIARPSTGHIRSHSSSWSERGDAKRVIQCLLVIALRHLSRLARWPRRRQPRVGLFPHSVRNRRCGVPSRPSPSSHFKTMNEAPESGAPFRRERPKSGQKFVRAEGRADRSRQIAAAGSA